MSELLKNKDTPKGKDESIQECFYDTQQQCNVLRKKIGSNTTATEFFIGRSAKTVNQPVLPTTQPKQNSQRSAKVNTQAMFQSEALAPSSELLNPQTKVVNTGLQDQNAKTMINAYYGKFDYPIKNLSTPNDIGNYIAQNFRYLSDQQNFGVSEYYATIPQMMECKATNGYIKGDCDDYSNFASLMLEKIGIKSSVIRVTTQNGGGHAVCVYISKNINGQYQVNTLGDTNNPLLTTYALGSTPEDALKNFYQAAKYSPPSGNINSVSIISANNIGRSMTGISGWFNRKNNTIISPQSLVV